MNNGLVEELATELGQLLASRRWLVTTAESCTGGGLAHAITGVAGSSKWFECGFVTYSNRAKNEQLGVASQLFDRWGAVSNQVVTAMAQGALSVAKAQLAVAISGIAGPEGGSDLKPVGTVWIAWALPSSCRSQCFLFQGDREQVRQMAIQEALKGGINDLRRACFDK